jgi:hypothetical protein
LDCFLTIGPIVSAPNRTNPNGWEFSVAFINQQNRHSLNPTIKYECRGSMTFYCKWGAFLYFAYIELICLPPLKIIEKGKMRQIEEEKCCWEII